MTHETYRSQHIMGTLGHTVAHLSRPWIRGIFLREYDRPRNNFALSHLDHLATFGPQCPLTFLPYTKEEIDMKTAEASMTDDGYKVVIEALGPRYIVRTTGLKYGQWSIHTIDRDFAVKQANMWAAHLGLYIHDRTTGLAY